MKNNPSNLCAFSIFSFLVAAVLLCVQTPADAGEKIGIKVMAKEAMGEYLADGNGMTLYFFTKDEKNISHCLEGCAVNWPPFYADPTAAASEGFKSVDLGDITRTDGRKQTTYKGMPLYYFKNDRYPGDTFGQGIGEAWFLVRP